MIYLEKWLLRAVVYCGAYAFSQSRGVLLWAERRLAELEARV